MSEEITKGPWEVPGAATGVLIPSKVLDCIKTWQEFDSKFLSLQEALYLEVEVYSDSEYCMAERDIKNAKSNRDWYANVIVRMLQDALSEVEHE